ncbi:DUF6916 family protein [Salipiger mucosus]|uniref:DUF6916 domain-containing protein n=1 Tax=Salipiger mucosus DSM 16094 TaxID=1123237 RepID=S9QLE8_9RHOB|nr:hypothetical protein [Salipiger mucosus]EPX82286.1 hypothetical protein Salmuc_03074 [Salipiger mucosus DSM 16094]
MTIDPITASAEDFAPYVGDTFRVESVAGPVPLVLDNVKRFDRSDVRDKRVEIDGSVLPARQAFALTFEGPVAPVLVSDTVELAHPALGRLVLFLSPFRQDDDCMLYEALFN